MSEPFDSFWSSTNNQNWFSVRLIGVDTVKQVASEAFQAGMVYGERNVDAAMQKMLEMAVINGCYCVCHSEASSRPACVHCRPDGWLKEADPYCGLTAKGASNLRALDTPESLASIRAEIQRIGIKK